jgi:hypothetical protein
VSSKCISTAPNRFYPAIPVGLGRFYSTSGLKGHCILAQGQAYKGRHPGYEMPPPLKSPGGAADLIYRAKLPFLKFDDENHRGYDCRHNNRAFLNFEIF